MDMLFQLLLLLEVDNYSDFFSFFTLITVSTAETHYQPPVIIFDCLVFVNIHQMVVKFPISKSSAICYYFHDRG